MLIFLFTDTNSNVKPKRECESVRSDYGFVVRNKRRNIG